MGIIDEAILEALNPILPTQPEPPAADQEATNPGGVEAPSVPSGPNLGEIAGALGPTLQVAVAAIALQVICDKVNPILPPGISIPGCSDGPTSTPGPTPTPPGVTPTPTIDSLEEFARFYDPRNPRDTSQQACNSAPFTPEEYATIPLSTVYQRNGYLYLDDQARETVTAGFYLGSAFEGDDLGFFEYKGDGTLPSFNPESCGGNGGGGDGNGGGENDGNDEDREPLS